LGCGPGRFTAALAVRGIAALGVDISAVAVAMTKRRGGRALHQDVFAPLPGYGRWANVLLADGNIGIGGDPVRTLHLARQLVAPDGLVIAEIGTLATGVTREYLRWETDHSVGEWFPWAHVGSDAVGALAESTDLRIMHTVETFGRLIAAMRVA
ncbi:MAG: methyltransferase domain-containing protein, partial [Acidimicrobiales bacterium]